MREACREMIGHHYIAGHGSHSTIYRCDGKGKILAVLPEGESRWIHYEKESVSFGTEGQDAEEKGTVVLYTLDGRSGKEREEAGAGLRIPPASLVLAPGEHYRYHGKLFFAEDYEDCRRKLVDCGQVTAESIPGYTVPRGQPAFLSSFQTVHPSQSQIDALDDYIEHFVWGGLQQTEDEPFPYGIYGIPDWHALRNSADPGNGGQTHLWRVYDYPHIALLYYNMYEAAAFAEGIMARLQPKEYLRRAYGTARALFTVPAELEGWTAYETGFYNELVIPEIVRALRREGMETEARVLEGHWDRKAEYFVQECKNVFGSEYPFDTTGFESTHVLAARGLELAGITKKERTFGNAVSFDRAVEFMENQTRCNIACRGLLEPA